MNPLLIAPKEPKLLRGGSTPFTVVVACDQAIAGETARQIHRPVLAQDGEKPTLQSRSWAFEDLKDPCAAEEATRSASAANLTIVATLSGKILPGQVKTWMERSTFSNHAQACALSIVIGDVPPERLPSTSACQYLKRVADEEDAKFLAAVFELPQSCSCYSLSDLMERSEASSSVLEKILNRPPPPPRWGINE